MAKNVLHHSLWPSSLPLLVTIHYLLSVPPAKQRLYYSWCDFWPKSPVFNKIKYIWVHNCCSPSKGLQYSVGIFPKTGILRKTTVGLGQDFSAAQARLSHRLKGKGTWLDEDQMLLHLRSRKTSPSSQVYIGGCLAGPAMDQSKSWSPIPLPFLLELVGMQHRLEGGCSRQRSHPWCGWLKARNPSLCCTIHLSIWTCLKFLSKPGLKSRPLKAPFFTYVL